MFSDKEKWDKIFKVIAVICLVLSLLVALLPCFVFRDEVLQDVITQYGSNDMTTWDENDLTSLFTDSVLSGVTDTLNTGVLSNMARSAVVLLGAGMVYTYSSNMYLAMAYFIILLLGVPALSLVAAGFHIWGKAENKRVMSCVFVGINLVLCVTIFFAIPGLCLTIVKNLVPELSTIYLQMIRTLVFQIMIRSMGIGFWGFIVLQILALGCGIYRLSSRDAVNSVANTTGNKVQAKAGVLVGISGMYAGAELPLDAAGVVLGRDASEAQLVIESPKVSRRHCKITYDPQKGKYTVIDYSTNGTFAGKRRLTKGTEEILPAGSILNIGDSKNSFRLQ